MNENIDLTKILKNCPKGWKFYSSVYGVVEFVEILPNVIPCPVIFKEQGSIHGVSIAGEYFKGKGECTFFPSKDQRDWNKFTAPWYKKDKFDPKTLQPFDKVLGFFNGIWNCDLYSNYNVNKMFPYICFHSSVSRIIPYNEKTKHLIGTTEEAPEYYRYWEE